MTKPSNYPIFDPDTISINYAEVSIRPYVRGSTISNPNNWVAAGELEKLTVTTASEEKLAWSKSQPQAAIIKTANVKPKTSIEFVTITNTKLLRAVGLMGENVDTVQAAEPNGKFQTGPVTPGDRVYLETKNGTVLGVYTDEAMTTPIEAADWVQTDFADTAFDFSPVLDPSIVGDRLWVKHSCPAVTSYEIQGGVKTTLAVQMRVRGVSDEGTKGTLIVRYLRAASKGGVDYISGNDDYAKQTYGGTALTTSDDGKKAATIWFPLDA